MPRAFCLVVAAALAAACSQAASSTVKVTSATVDPSYSCPARADNAPYDVHATVGIHNGTSSTVTVKAVNAVMTLETVSGQWLEKTGDVYDAGAAAFTPTTVAAGSNTTLKVTIHSACTSGAPAAPASHGDYKVTLRVTTSAGAFTISAADLHRIAIA